MIEIIDHSDDILLIAVITVGLDVSKEFDLVNGLIEVVFVILNDLHTDFFVRVKVVTSNGFGEGC
jgi:hypothetical protein